MNFLTFSRLAIVVVALIPLLAVSVTAKQPLCPPDGWTDGYVLTND